ncbi:MAG TPA: arginine--tRNA ligase [Planctomycetota bacterium]|nr:arginine--tRNA ligase [Planctomycetota bacterium]
MSHSSEEDLRVHLLSALQALGVENIPSVEPILEPPADLKFGDATSSVALRLAKQLKKPPRKIADELAAKLAGWTTSVAGAGFINFDFGTSFAGGTIDQARSGDARFGASGFGQSVKFLVEHTSANPTGPLHIAHGRQAAIGDSLARILAHAGFTVGREFYVNDAGNQIDNLGKSILWRYLESKGVTFAPETRGLDEDRKPRVFLISQGPGPKLELEEKNAYRGDYIRDIAKRVNEPATVVSCARLGLEVLLPEIRKDLDQFRVTFDKWSSQAELEASGAVSELMETLKTKGHIQPKDGALWITSMAYGDTQDEVLVKSDGQFTYLAPDIAYHQEKFARGWQRLVDLWGPDHHAHILRMKTALKMLGLPHENFDVLIVQYCRLLKDGQEVKMGKRLASYVTLRELLEEVGVDATRWFFAMRKTDSPLDFDMTLAVKQSAENPVYYVQYAHARIASVLRKGRERGLYLGPFDASALGPEEILLVRHVRGLQRAVERAARDLDPSTICTYAHGLASAYQHYQTAGKNDPAKRILIDDERLRRARLATISAVKVALQNALGLVGVEAPDRMHRDEEE